MFGFLKKKLEKVFSKAMPKKNIVPELEVALLEAGVSLEVIDKLIARVKKSDEPKKALRDALKEEMVAGKLNLNEKPYVIMIAGINGTGKTTTLAKLASSFIAKDLKVVVAASDTFRAAAIEQLAEHCKRLKIPMIKHKYGADPAAVAYDAIEHARAKGLDVVLIDTSGRLHIDSGLMRELEKIKRVASPHLSLLVVDATTGNDAVEQARAFSPFIDGFFISKADIDERGGATVSVSAVTGKPIYFLGTGQKYDDFEKFKPLKVIKALGL